MKYLMICILLISLAWSAEEIYPFQHEADRSAFVSTLKQLRCMVCQNQDIYDSNAPWALDVKSEIYQMILSGKSESEIINLMQDKYGDFILLDPTASSHSIFLLIFPFIILITGFSVVLYSIHRKKNLNKANGNEA